MNMSVTCVPKDTMSQFFTFVLLRKKKHFLIFSGGFEKKIRHLWLTSAPLKVKWHPVHPQVKMMGIQSLKASLVPDRDVIFATGRETVLPILDLPPQKGTKFHLIQGYEFEGDKEASFVWNQPFHKIVISKWLYQKTISLGVSPDTLTYIPNGVNFDIFKLVYPIEKRPFQVAMMFSKIPAKGCNDGLQALEKAKEIFPVSRSFFSAVVASKKIYPTGFNTFKTPH